MKEFNIIQQKIADSRPILERDFSVKNIGIFGSFARGTSRNESDVDILVEFSKPVGLFLFGSLIVFLERLLEKKVDLATKKALKPLIRDEILQETIYV